MIGVVTTSYPRWPGDPAGNFVAGHVEALRALGHCVDVVAAGHSARQSGGDRAARVPGEPTSDAVRVSDTRHLFYTGGAPDAIEAAPLRGALAGAAFTARLATTVARRARHWDSIVAHWLVPSAVAAIPTSLPLLAIAHGGDIHTLRRLGLLAPTLHALHLRRARLAFVSDQLRAIARIAAPSLGRWLDDALVQPMGIALDRFRALERAPSDPPSIVIASRLVPLKGIDVAIAAMAHIRAPARLVIAGDGPERRSLVATAAPSITFLGQVDLARRDRLLREASVVVVPSRIVNSGRTEGTPLIALEALAAGVPVVASNVGGLSELDRLAVQLVPPDDPRALALAIDRVLADPPAADELRQSVAHLDWQRVTRRLLGEPGQRTSYRSA